MNGNKFQLFIISMLIGLLSIIFINLRKAENPIVSKILRENKNKELEKILVHKIDPSEIDKFVIYDFIPPKSVTTIFQLQTLSLNLLGEEINITIQNGDIISPDEASYLGFIFPKMTNAYLGKVAVSYFRGIINGTVDYQKNYYKLIPIKKNIFAVVKLKEKPILSCGNARSIKAHDTLDIVPGPNLPKLNSSIDTLNPVRNLSSPKINSTIPNTINGIRRFK